LLLNYVVGPLLFLAIALSIYRQLSRQPNLRQHWEQLWHNTWNEGLVFLLPAILLIVLNWGLEALKWRQLVNHLMPITWFRALLSVLAGVSFTMITPNRMGEFLGRVLYMPDGSRIKAATLTALSSLSQLIITLTAGIMGVAYLALLPNVPNEQWPALLTNVLLYGTATVLALGLLVYFNLGRTIRIVEKWPPVNRYAIFIHALGEISHLELLKILALAAARYGVFLLQYWLVFRALQLDLTLPQMLAGTSTMFLIIAIVPTISLAELGIRSQISLFVFSLFTSNQLGILLVSALVWLLNIILPAFAGSLILLSVKLFNRQSLETAS
jgi:hypothetical protein